MALFTRDHEMLVLDGAFGAVGISPYAASLFGPVVRVDLPPLGRALRRDEEAAIVESRKAASAVAAPAAGRVVALNAGLAAEPGLVAEGPGGRGWLFRLALADPRDLNALLDEAAYEAYCRSLG